MSLAILYTQGASTDSDKFMEELVIILTTVSTLYVTIKS